MTPYSSENPRLFRVLHNYEYTQKDLWQAVIFRQPALGTAFLAAVMDYIQKYKIEDEVELTASPNCMITSLKRKYPGLKMDIFASEPLYRMGEKPASHLLIDSVLFRRFDVAHLMNTARFPRTPIHSRHR